MPDDTPDTPPQNGQPKRQQSTYGDDQRAHALLQLRLNNNNVERTSKALGIPASTLRTWRSESCPAGQRAEAMVREQSVPLSAKFRQVAEEYIAEGLAKKHLLSPYQAVIGACAATDKALVLEGLPNQIHAQASDGPKLTPEQVRAFQALIREMREAGLPITKETVAAYCRPLSLPPADVPEPTVIVTDPTEHMQGD